MRKSFILLQKAKNNGVIYKNNENLPEVEVNDEYSQIYDVKKERKSLAN